MTFYPFSPKTATFVSASTNLIFMIYFNILYATWERVRSIIRVLRVTKSQHWSNPTVSGFKPVWTPSQTITDPYLIWLDSDLPPGQYRLIVGWYLLADLRRLPVLDAIGQPIDDRLLVTGLVVP